MLVNYLVRDAQKGLGIIAIDNILMRLFWQCKFWIFIKDLFVFALLFYQTMPNGN